MSAPPYLGEVRSQPKEHSGSALSRANRRTARGSAAATWTVVSELPARIGSDGLLDAASAGQIVILKNLSRQFRPSGLSTSVRLDLKGPLGKESVENVVRDYATSGFDVLHSAANDAPIHPRTRLIAPDGSVAREWQDFAVPGEIGLAVRRALGEPIYFQMESENNKSAFRHQSSKPSESGSQLCRVSDRDSCTLLRGKNARR